MRLGLATAVLPSVRLAYRQFVNTEAGASAYCQFKAELYSEGDSLVQSLNNAILQRLPLLDRNPLRICDIGGGDGKRIKGILAFLHKKFGLNFNLDFVEQSSVLMRAFDASNIDTFCKTRTFEMLFEDAALSARSYDLVLLIHSIFAFENDFAVNKVLSMPNRGGVIVAVSNAQDSFLGGLKRIVDTGFGDSRFEINDLIGMLENHGSVVQETFFETRWAVFKEQFPQHIAMLLEWLTLGRAAELDRSCMREAQEYIREHVVDLGDRLLFSEQEVVLVTPPCEV